MHIQNSINAALMQPSIPVFTTVLAIIIGIEVLRYKTLHGGLKVLGILSAVGGAVIVIAMGEEMAESESLIIGNLCLVVRLQHQMSFVIISLDQLPVHGRVGAPAKECAEKVPPDYSQRAVVCRGRGMPVHVSDRWPGPC